jgi:CRISPR system Cascade subunit CasB
MKPTTFAPDRPAGQTLDAWWRNLAENRGDRAELRRAHTPDAAALVPATVHLVTALRTTEAARHGGWVERILVIAGVTAHLDPNRETVILAPNPANTLPERMAAARGDRPVVSELRFRRLLRTPRSELYRPMIRILALLDGEANLFELAESLFWWGPRIQKEWAFTYFPKLPKTA